ncbi:MAG: hypothetical protein ACPGMR_03185 [Pontibacterium sp.]
MSMGDSQEVEESEEQRALAQVGAEQWNYAQETLVPLQDMYIEKVNQMDSQANKDFLEGKTNIGMQSGLASGFDQVVSGASGAGLDLSSGALKGGLVDSALGSAQVGGDTAARALTQQDELKVQGLQNVVAMGAGQETQAIAGLADSASLAQSTARQNATNSFNRRSANLQTLGTIAGAGTSYYQNQPTMKLGSTTQTSDSYQYGVTP